MKLTEMQTKILDEDGHQLVTGGPGSGKTTVSILKAINFAECNLKPEQRVLFLSFARATVSRILEAIKFEQKIPRNLEKRIDVQTYHSFFWQILNSHGYLTGLPRLLSVLTTTDEAIALSDIRKSKSNETKEMKSRRFQLEKIELERLAYEEGKIGFDLFANLVGDLLHRSKRIRSLLSTMYPFIVLDEFQDTDPDQWRVVQALGEFSTLLALADPSQRIYDFRRADPERLNHIRTYFYVKEFDLSIDNHRSPGTDITLFGNEILTGNFSKVGYDNVDIREYMPFENPAMTKLVTETYIARKRLVNSGKTNWSLVILVPTKKMTRIVSDVFLSPPAGKTPIFHSAVIELEGAILGAELISYLMQPEIEDKSTEQFIELLVAYFLGKSGDTPIQTNIKEGQSIQKAYEKWNDHRYLGKKLNQRSKIIPILEAYNASKSLKHTGNPDSDWKSIRNILEMSCSPNLKDLAKEVWNLRILNRGTQLRQDLSQNWRDNGVYKDALNITKQAFIKQHFATQSKSETGVIVMNMHKAKGKQFDEVIIFEGWPRRNGNKIFANPDRIVRGNVIGNVDDQTRQNLRVSVTRGKQRVTILTPAGDKCVLLP